MMAWAAQAIGGPGEHMREGDGKLKLTQVKLAGFKAAYAPPPVDLGMFNVLIGRNGSGKSTLIEALQWVDTGIRQGIREACDPFNGIANLLHKRTDSPWPSFDIALQYSSEDPLKCYLVRVGNHEGLPEMEGEVVETRIPPARVDFEKSDRLLQLPERPTLNHGQQTLGTTEGETTQPARPESRLADSLSSLGNYWRHAVFLKMLPNALSAGARLDRKSWEPILDESGRLLPALLAEVLRDPYRKAELVRQLQTILPWTRDLEVSKPPSRDVAASYSFHEHVGDASEGSTVLIPAWMVSEGTRRLTAILALLLRDPAPSLLCIEEIENGLDPWTVRFVLRELQSAADRGIQVIATTHSPWVLDDVPLESILQVRRTQGDIVYQRFADRPEVKSYAPSVPAGTRYVNEAE